MDELVLLAGKPEPALLERVAQLTHEGITTCAAATIDDAMRVLERGAIAAVLVQGRLADGNANTLLRRIRAQPLTAGIAVIIIGEEGDDIERIVALELGADEFLGPSVLHRELILRLRAVLRRCRPAYAAPQARERIGLIEIERPEHRTWVEGQPCDLSVAEFRVLLALASPPGVVYSRERLRQLLEPEERSSGDRWIDARVARLRERLGAAALQVETVRGVGYRLHAQP